MHLEYNDVHLELLEIEQMERHNVYDPSGTDLLYVRWVISASCVYSPSGRWPVGTAVTSLSPDTTAQVAGNTVRPQNRRVRAEPPKDYFLAQEENVKGTPNGYTALYTDVELRTRLSLPRRPLKIWAYDTTGKPAYLLICPKPGYVCDPNNGPKPLGPPDIVDVTGEGLTFGVHFQVECATLPNPDVNDQLILSHRWQMRHESDENHYLTRVVDGEVVFNASLLEAYDLNPDWFRSQLFHAIPLGFRRQVPVVTLSPDGNVLKYTITDVDTTITFDPGDTGATQIAISERVQYSASTLSRILMEPGR